MCILSSAVCQWIPSVFWHKSGDWKTWTSATSLRFGGMVSSNSVELDLHLRRVIQAQFKNEFSSVRKDRASSRVVQGCGASNAIVDLEHSLPFLRNLIGQFRGTKSLSCPQLRSPQLSCPLLSSPLLICPMLSSRRWDCGDLSDLMTLRP